MENKPEKCATCKPLTNGDKIRAMSDSKYADWLRSPVEESHE